MLLLKPPPRPFRPAPRLVLPRVARGRASVESTEAPPSGVRVPGETDFESAFEAAFDRVFAANATTPPLAGAPTDGCFFCGASIAEGEASLQLDYYERLAHAACEREARAGRVHYRGR